MLPRFCLRLQQAHLPSYLRSFLYVLVPHPTTDSSPRFHDRHIDQMPSYPCAKLKLDQFFLQWLAEHQDVVSHWSQPLITASASLDQLRNLLSNSGHVWQIFHVNTELAWPSSSNSHQITAAFHYVGCVHSRPVCVVHFPCYSTPQSLSDTDQTLLDLSHPLHHHLHHAKDSEQARYKALTRTSCRMDAP